MRHAHNFLTVRSYRYSNCTDHIRSRRSLSISDTLVSVIVKQTFTSVYPLKPVYCKILESTPKADVSRVYSLRIHGIPLISRVLQSIRDCPAGGAFIRFTALLSYAASFGAALSP